ncbi:hypothetical protein [Flavobacterium aurantiibacter]|uniref:hypothetical protein n=1 Tax=Flavobacterium aurantiibacter TaxID=2023067 RepID=UPI001FAF21FB|nr:hypothetical protein [Flavobacterium aurantiibacter]
MKNSKLLQWSTLLFAFFFVVSSFGQKQDLPESEVEFWDRVQFGGGAGLAIGSEFTSVSLSPQAIYTFNKYVAGGLGLNAGYIRERNFYEAQNYGVSIIGLVSPFPAVQLSAELNQTNYTFKYEDRMRFREQFWDTALLLGAGYSNGSMTIGLQYDVLYDYDRSINGSPLMPFIRVFF